MIRHLAIAFFVLLCMPVKAQKQISIETDNLQLLLSVNAKGKLFQSYLGQKLLESTNVQSGRHEAYVPAGTNNLFEPAISVTHTDGNPSLELLFVADKTEKTDDNVSTTTISLKDPEYP